MLKDIESILITAKTHLTILENQKNIFKNITILANFTFINCYNFYLEQYKLGFLIEEITSKWKNIYIAEQIFCVLPIDDIDNIICNYL